MRLLGKIGNAVYLVVSSMILVSCAQQHSKENQTTVAEDVLNKAVLESEKGSRTPDFVEQTLLSGGLQLSNDEPDQGHDYFDVSVKNIPAQTFFLSLVADSNTNIVTHPEVDGNVTLDLKRVTVDEVLQVVRDVYGYEYRKQGNIYTIYPRKLRTEIFPINYIDITRVGVTDTTVSLGEMESNSGNSNSGGNNNTGSNSNSANILGMAGVTQGGNNHGITPGSRVQTLNKTDFWQVLGKTISRIINEPNEGRSVMVNPQAGLAVVTAMPNEIHAVRTFLERSELSVKRQVILETQIVEVQLSEGFEAGINWNAIQGELLYSNNISRSKITDGSNLVEDVQQYGPRTFSSIFRVLDVRDLLSLLETQGSVQVLSSPRVSTVNNQKAVIRVGSDEFYVTGISNNTTSTAATTTISPELELSSFFSGISLDVTPQISESGDVILHIHPIVSDVKDQVKEVTIGDSKITLPLALRDIRESDSIVRAKSGQVIVLGGLMQQTESEQNGKQPWLGEIPGLNALFRTKNTLSRKTELVILLKPTVVEGDTWKNELKNIQGLGAAMGDEYRSR